MIDSESKDRQALGILSDTVSEELGATSKVAKEVRRAYTSGRQIDRFMARAAFDALPGWQRSTIGSKATQRASHAARERGAGSTARDWKDLERQSQPWPPSRDAGGGADGIRGERVIVPRPPRFLTRDD